MVARGVAQMVTPPAGPPVGLHEVTLRYGDRAVVRGVTWPVEPGERWALLGANGSGKTTVLRMLSGALEPTSGAVLRAGEPLRYHKRDLIAHRSAVQLVVQDPDDQLFSADVAGDISFGPLNLGLDDTEVVARVEEACALLSLAELRERPVHELSWGQRKRVAIAGCVAMRPSVLLLDEPTAGLDPVGVHELLAALTRLEEQGTTLVMATHDVDLALAWSTRAAVVCDGTIHHGRTAEVLDDLPVLRRARLHRPWPLELTHRLVAAGRIATPVVAPRTLDDVTALLRE